MMETLESIPLCDDCKQTCDEFKKIIELKSSGISIYRIQNDVTGMKKLDARSKSDSIILHNTSEKKINKQEYMNELSQYKTKCTHCKMLIHTVRCLLDEMPDIKENEIRAVCVHCQRTNKAGKCKRCELIMNRYVTSRVKQYEACQMKIKDWLQRIREILQTLLDKDNLCKHNIYNENSSAEIQRLFREFKSPGGLHEHQQPKIEDFPKPLLSRPKGQNMEYLHIAETGSETGSLNKIVTSCEYFPDNDSAEQRSICRHREELVRRKDHRNNNKNFRYSGRHERDYLYPGKDDRDYRYLGWNEEDYPYAYDKGYFHPRSYHRDRSYPERDARGYRFLPRDDMEFHSERDDRSSHSQGTYKKDRKWHPARDDWDYRNSGRDMKTKIKLPSDSEGRSNRYGISERDQIYGNEGKENEYYFPNRDDKDSNRTQYTNIKDKRLSQKEKDRAKATVGGNGKAKEGKQTPDNGQEKLQYDKIKKDYIYEKAAKGKDEEKKGRHKEKEQEAENKKGQRKEEHIEYTGAKEQEKEKKNRTEIQTADMKGTTKKQKELNTETIGDKSSKGGERRKPKDAEKADSKVKIEKDFNKGTNRSVKQSKDKSSKEKIREGEILSPGKTKGKRINKTDGEESLKDIEKSPKRNKEKSPRVTSEERLLLQMMNDRKDKRERDQDVKKQKEITLPVFEDLPEVNIPEPVVEVEVSESVIVCGDQQPYRPTEMIRGVDIIPYDSHHKGGDRDTNEPLFFSTQPECPPLAIDILQPTDTSVSSVRDKKSKGNVKTEILPPSGVVKFQLSKREFIDKGWTVLPTTKVMRRMTIYKMLPVNPNYNWFARHISEKQVFYDTGEQLALINEDGTGLWYYKNGSVALEYYDSSDSITNQRYVIYSYGEDEDTGKMKAVTILALFDFLGNGVVYDHRGNIRLKYNQSEGMVVDEKIGPPGVWKWHMLNDPPALEPMFLDTRSKHPDPRVEALASSSDKESKSSRSSAKSSKSLVGKSKNSMRDEVEEMLAIELENFAKAQAVKMTQIFKPFQIARKIFKINHQFSLKILDQTNIHLIFRDGQTSLKLNLGMQLVSTDIIDSNATEIVHAPTPYDVLPAKTPSIAHIHKYLMKAKKGKP